MPYCTATCPTVPQYALLYRGVIKVVQPICNAQTTHSFNGCLNSTPCRCRGPSESRKQTKNVNMSTYLTNFHAVRLVKEAKGMSSENVDLRKHMSSEQERWRALERSRAKQGERRRTEMEQKCDDIHALRYRLNVLAAVVGVLSVLDSFSVVFLSPGRNAQINVTTAPMGNVFCGL